MHNQFNGNDMMFLSANKYTLPYIYIGTRDHPAEDEFNRVNLKMPPTDGIEGERDEINSTSLSKFTEGVDVLNASKWVDAYSHRATRGILTLVVLCGIGVAIYQIADKTSVYFSYTTTTDVQVIDATQLDFPQITFCNENLFRRATIKQYGKLQYRNRFTIIFHPGF